MNRLFTIVVVALLAVNTGRSLITSFSFDGCLAVGSLNDGGHVGHRRRGHIACTVGAADERDGALSGDEEPRLGLHVVETRPASDWPARQTQSPRPGCFPRESNPPRRDTTE